MEFQTSWTTLLKSHLLLGHSLFALVVRLRVKRSDTKTLDLPEMM